MRFLRCWPTVFLYAGTLLSAAAWYLGRYFGLHSPRLAFAGAALLIMSLAAFYWPMRRDRQRAFRERAEALERRMWTEAHTTRMQGEARDRAT